MRILIVDDSKAMRMILMRTLRQAGFQGHTLVEAANGKEALDRISTDAPHVVLSDWNMPEMGGIELLEALVKQKKGIPLGFVTSEASADMKALAFSAGARFFITKPFNSDTLKETLSPFLE